jgi:asparagine synthase (glutamine-hydrolysing)
MKRYLARIRFEPDLGLASQPAAITLDGYHVFWRGYIANFAEIQRQTDGHRHLDRPTTEAELFLLAYQRWGLDLPRHVLGEYAVVVFDKTRNTVLLAHDELGLIPLFYAKLKDEIVVASHLEDAVQLTGVGQLDEEYIADYLSSGRHLGKRTPYTHIHRVLPGQSVVWKSGRLTEHSIWTLNKVQPLHYSYVREYEEQLRFLTTQAVMSCMRETQRVWCELSGGLDSSTVLAFAVRSGAKNVEAVSFVYSESQMADERKWMDYVLDKYPVPWHSIDVDKVRPFTEMPDEFVGEPNLFLPNAAKTRRYHQMLEASHVDTVLTGMGGDAAFVGDAPAPYYLADLLRTFRLAQFWTEIQSWRQASHQKRPSMYWLDRFGIRPCVRHWKGQFIESTLTPVPWLSRRFIESHPSAHGELSNSPSLTSVADSWTTERMMRTAHSVSLHFQIPGTTCDFRHPLMYRPLLAYMLSVPWEVKLHPECDRLLQRRAFEDVLPKEIVLRGNKSGTDQAFYSGLEAGSEFYDRLITHPQIVQRGYADLDAWREALRQARHGRTVGILFLLASASLEIWLQQLQAMSPAGGVILLDAPNTHHSLGEAGALDPNRQC